MPDSLDAVAATSADVTAAETTLAAAITARDTAMQAAHDAGWSFGQIAAAANLSPARVGQILGHPHGRVGRPRRS